MKTTAPRSRDARSSHDSGLTTASGNFPCNDLQQVSTGLVGKDRQAVRVLAEVCSVYPRRNEALINAGALALSRETSPNFPGFGAVVGKPGWHVARVSQEHGIVGWKGSPGDDSGEASPAVADNFHVGEKVFLHINHACITAAGHQVYFVVDENDTVLDSWVPWRGW
jgi:D-serine ammonia-lyase